MFPLPCRNSIPNRVDLTNPDGCAPDFRAHFMENLRDGDFSDPVGGTYLDSYL